MDPNRERVDDEVGEAMRATLAGLTVWFTAPPRREKGDAPICLATVGLAIIWIESIISGAQADTLTMAVVASPLGVSVVSSLVCEIAETLPARAIRTAMWLRMLGVALLVVGAISILIYALFVVLVGWFISLLPLDSPQSARVAGLPVAGMWRD